MNALATLFSSEKGLLATLGLVSATVFVVLGTMTIDQWSAFTQVIFGSFVIGKTVTTVGAAIATRGQLAPAMPAPAEPVVQGA